MYELLKQNPKMWDLFTKNEEYFPNKLDKHDRFIYANSKDKCVLEPEVSKYLVKNGMGVEYPDGRKFAVCLTHDIDAIYPTSIHSFLASLSCIKSLNFSEFKSHVLWRTRGKKYSPFLNFKQIIDLEEKYNAKSSFYFIATEKDPLRFRYDIEDIESELGFIADNGWEVGLHGGYYSYNDLEEIRKEKKRLEAAFGKSVIGYRNHYLKFKIPDSWELLSKAGFKYDTTFGYSDMVGFRNGMCHPFVPYNLNLNQEIGILEIPLVIMDTTLFDFTKSYGDAWKYAKELIDNVEKYNGVITLLWHNHVFSYPCRNHWAKLYDKILKYCYEKNAWITSGNEIYNWWEHGSKSFSNRRSK